MSKIIIMDRELCRKRIRDLIFENSQDKSIHMLAEEKGIPYNTILKWIHRIENLPNTESIYQICKAFNVSADYLLGLSDIKERTAENCNSQTV